MSVTGALLGLAGLAVGIVLLARRYWEKPEPVINLPLPDAEPAAEPQPVFPEPAPPDAPERSPAAIAEALDAAAKKHKPPLQWRTSIVDLCKAAGVDSSQENRELLAEQSGFKGYDARKAEHNIELHKMVLVKLRDPKFGGLVLG